jgi:hypothetical protein
MALSGTRGDAFRGQVDEVRTRTWIAVPGRVDIWGLPMTEMSNRV